MSAQGGVPGAVVPPAPPREEPDPIAEIHDAWEWARDFFNRRAGIYTVILGDMGLALAEALG